MMKLIDALLKLESLGCVAIATNGDDVPLDDAIVAQQEFEASEQYNSEIDTYSLDIDTLKVFHLNRDGFRDSTPDCTGLTSGWVIP